ncbi:hypothetical protein AB0O91_21065 [Kitasatospora sp. NPDC089797]|uniref:hypothetical protein n=1 Tax=Kitasatospora sp. NPDC089797 TaxID=3155298 RepID=UPI00341D5152
MADPGPHEAIITVYGQSQQQAVAGTLAGVDSLWAELAPDDLTGSWLAGIGERIVRAVQAGKLLAATTGQPYVDAMVAADGLTSDYLPGAARVPARAWTLSASDGRPLDSLLYLPVTRTKSLLQGGLTLQQAMLKGLLDLQRMVASEVADAGSSAAGVAMVANRKVTGYIRRVRSGACARCAILAGRWYRYDAGFQRHKRCQCYGEPATSARHLHATGAREFFDGLSQEEQDRRFTRAGAQAIRDGADVGQVVNARKGITTIDAYDRSVVATLQGTGRTGIYYRRERDAAEAATGIRYARGAADLEAGLPRFKVTAPRLMPEEIYKLADGRDELIGLLRRYGYLT